MIKSFTNQSIFTQFKRKENSDSKSDINNNKQLNVERDTDWENEITESDDRQTEDTH